jgi:hypothetical protein
MKITKLKNTCAVALATGLFALGTTAVQARTCSVPSGTYPDIQSAATDPSCATINVAPGLYNENVTVTHSCEINGAQANTPVSARTSGGPAESTVYGNTAALAVFTISATDVTIDGFTITDFVNSGAASGVTVTGSGSDAAILNNIFDDIRTTDTGSNGTAQAVYLTAGGPDNVNIQDNEMKNVHSYGSAKGVLIGDNGGTNPSQNVLIKGNSIQNISSTSSGAYGVLVANMANVSGLKINSNTINDLSGLFGSCWVHAIGLEGDTPGVEVRDNDISNLNTGSTDRVAVWFESNPSFGTAKVHGNNFMLSAMAFGIAVHPALSGGSVNGTCNWWNSPTGPTAASNPGGTGAKVSPSVNYAPWQIAPAPGGECFGSNVPTTANQCKNGGWMTSVRADGTTFKNQGDCIQYVNTGR